MSEHDLPFLKWYPYKAMSSVRWRMLSLAEKGLFHELYDLASTCSPRGSLYSQDCPLSIEDLASACHSDANTIGPMLSNLLELGLLTIDPSGGYVCPQWNKHQRNGPLRRRNRNEIAAAISNHRSRARRSGLPCDLTIEEWQATVTVFAGKCAYCGRGTGKIIIMEHLVPFPYGGFTLGNILPACARCNTKKGSQDWAEWMTKEGHDVKRLQDKLAEIHKLQRGGAQMEQGWNDDGTPDKEEDKEEEVEIEKEEEGEEGGSPSPSDIVNAWNKLGKPFPPVAQLTTKRSRALRLRLANDYWRNNWQVALETISKSPFCKGENDRGWVANFDFFLRPDTVTKTREGAYDENAAPSASAKVKAKLAQWAGKGGKA